MSKLIPKSLLDKRINMFDKKINMFFVFVISIFISIFTVLTLLSVSNAADTLSLKSPGAEVKSIRFDEKINMFEVVASDGTIYYMSKDRRYFFFGTIIDMKEGKNITEERKTEVFRINFSELNLNDAIKIPARKGGTKENTKKVAVFIDPSCPWCKKLYGELKKLEDVTIYVFFAPLSSKDLLRKIWCSKDVNVLDKVFTGETISAEKIEVNTQGCDDSALDRNLVLTKKNAITGYPTIIFENGKRNAGYVPYDKLVKLINDNSTDPNKKDPNKKDPSKKDSNREDPNREEERK